jgi:hypothetical protein
MSNSWLTIQITLKRTKIMLEEVCRVMPNSSSAKQEVLTAYNAVKNLIEDKNVQAASGKVEYEELIKKLQAEKVSFTQEEWEDAAKW